MIEDGPVGGDKVTRVVTCVTSAVLKRDVREMIFLSNHGKI